MVPILLMDEPFGSVDPLNRENLQQVLSRMLEENRTTLPILREDDTVHYITYESLVAHLKEMSQ
jgi:ABC-type proline/glycine betaine transport system ATPase subunit